MPRPLPLIALALVGVLAAASPAAAKWRTARCVLASEGSQYRGPCAFQAERGGSFSVKSPKPGGSLLGAQMISVGIYIDDEAEVRGLTRAGINSRWASVRRSANDRACWIGEGISICVY